MGKKRVKIPNELKLKYAKLCYENKMSKSEAARQLCVSYSDILGWVYRYRENGELAFLSTGNNNVYPTELIVPFGSRIPVHQQDIPYQAGESRKELVAMIENYIYYYNNERYQRRFGVMTPMEKYESYFLAA